LDDVGVLVVEGDLRSRRALVRLVDAMPGYVVVAESATLQGAVQLARLHSPAIALVDLDVTGPVGGLVLTRDLSALGIAVVAMSSEAGARPGSDLAGASAFHDKSGPTGKLPEALASAARSHAEGSRPASRRAMGPNLQLGDPAAGAS
jgi:DNA-binding NarL/FixJ family response regulator